MNLLTPSLFKIKTIIAPSLLPASIFPFHFPVSLGSTFSFKKSKKKKKTPQTKKSNFSLKFNYTPQSTEIIKFDKFSPSGHTSVTSTWYSNQE